MLNKSSPQIAELFEQISELALSYPNTDTLFSFGHHMFFRDLKGRTFLTVKQLPDKLEVGLRVSVKKLADDFIKLPFVTTHPYTDHEGWRIANLTTPTQLALISDWITISYHLNKPIRTPADLLPNESAQLLDFLTQIRQSAARYTNDSFEEYFPHGTRAFRAKKAKGGVGQIFMYAHERLNYLYVSVRLPFGEHEHAISLPFIEIPKYIGHKNWVGAKITTQEELDQVLEWVGLSYNLNQPARKKP